MEATIDPYKRVTDVGKLSNGNSDSIQHRLDSIRGAFEHDFTGRLDRRR